MNKLKLFWKKIINYIKYLFSHPRDVLLPTLLAEIIFWIPVWVSALFALIISPWWWSVTLGVIAFWCAPLTPAIGLQIGLIVAMERFINKKKEKKKNAKRK